MRAVGDAGVRGDVPNHVAPGGVSVSPRLVAAEWIRSCDHFASPALAISYQQQQDQTLCSNLGVLNARRSNGSCVVLAKFRDLNAT